MPYLSPQAKRDKAKRDLAAAKTPARRKKKAENQRKRRAAAKKYGKECQEDMINVEDKESLAKEAVAAGADIIGVHTGLDAQAAGHTPFADLAAIAALNTGAKISVAGGVKAATAQEVKDAGAAIIVAGAAIYGAADPAAAAAEITSIAH